MSALLYPNHAAGCGVNWLADFLPCTCGAAERLMQEVNMVAAAHGELTDAALVELYQRIAAGAGEHGSFVRAFADVVARADRDNLTMLRPAAIFLMVKYKLMESVRADTTEE